MKGLGVAIWAESLKAKKSKMFVGTIIFFVFIGIMMGLLLYVSRHPEIADRSTTVKAKVSLLGSGDWKSFFNLMLQLVLTLGTIGNGLVASWVFGREYSEKVIKDIIALPVSRITIIIAKLFVTFIWCLMLSIIIILSGFLVGVISNTPGWSEINLGDSLSNYIGIAVLNMFLVTLVAFVASLGRGYLLSIAYVILTLIITQLFFVGLPAFATSLPWAFPALLSGIGGEAAPPPTNVSYVVYILAVLFGFIATAGWWRVADQKQ
jgi:ABC-2 type transport system permease protein